VNGPDHMGFADHERATMTVTSENRQIQRNASGTDPARDGDLARGLIPHQAHSIEHVHSVLRELPSHGWTAGWIGRRDRALLVLSHVARLPYPVITELTAGDLAVADGIATIRTPAGVTTLRYEEDDLLCGPCSLARWVHALDLTVVYPDGRVIAAVIARAVPLKADSPHLCQSNNSITEITARVSLLPPIDQWGHPVRTVPPVLHTRFLQDRAEQVLSRTECSLESAVPG
jgi:hypothetical protein